MGAATDHALGRNLRFFCKKEAAAGGAYGTASQEALAGADAAKVLSSSMEFTVTRNDRMDARGTRSIQERITGKQEVSWSCESYLLPAGSTTAPDIDPLIEGAMGGAFGASTAKTYKLSDSNALPTVHMARTANDVFREDLFGCWVEEMSISASGGEEPKISFSGGAFNYVLTGTGTTEGTGSSATSLVTESGNGVNFMVGSVISFNSLADKIVTAKSTDTLTIASSSWSDAQAITPTTYTETTAGNPLNGIGGSLTLNSVTLPVTAFDVTITNGVKPLSDAAFEKGTSDFIAGYRSVKGNISVRARKDFIKSLAQRYVQTTATAGPSFSSVPIRVDLGSVSGKQVVVFVDTAELDFAAIDVPEAEEAILNIPFTALATSGGGDEIRIAWNQ
tara:strand:+ start:6603 stop:7778 length:1176 start_codon:yes stop_codon:yes gene_type:complete